MQETAQATGSELSVWITLHAPQVGLELAGKLW